MIPKHVVRAISFDNDGVVIEYVTPSEDIRDNRMLRNHSLFIPATDDFDSDLADLEKAAQTCLRLALAAFATALPADLEAEEPDGPSPYDHPDDGGTA